MKVPLLTQVPLEPKLLLACEGGKCFMAEHPTSKTAKCFESIVSQLKAFK